MIKTHFDRDANAHVFGAAPSDHSNRTKQERIARLRNRLRDAGAGYRDTELRAVLIALLDLLRDEL